MIHPKYQGSLFLYFNTIEQLFHQKEEAVKAQALLFLEVVPGYVSAQATRAKAYISKKSKSKHTKAQVVA